MKGRTDTDAFLNLNNDTSVMWHVSVKQLEWYSYLHSESHASPKPSFIKEITWQITIVMSCTAWVAQCYNNVTHSSWYEGFLNHQSPMNSVHCVSGSMWKSPVVLKLCTTICHTTIFGIGYIHVAIPNRYVSVNIPIPQLTNSIISTSILNKVEYYRLYDVHLISGKMLWWTILLMLLGSFSPRLLVMN